MRCCSSPERWAKASPRGQSGRHCDQPHACRGGARPLGLSAALSRYVQRVWTGGCGPSGYGIDPWPREVLIAVRAPVRPVPAGWMVSRPWWDGE